MIHMYCECGCGGKTPLATKTRAYLGTVKGVPIRFLPGHGKRGRFGRYKQERYTIEDRGFSSPCWIWRLAQIGQGYGCEWDSGRGRMVGAHILAYERGHGPVPAGKELHHLCRVRLCVNPDHLMPVTHLENIRLGDYRANNHNARKTHCPQGHPYEGDNLMVEKNGTRRCRQCRRERTMSVDGGRDG